MAPAKASTTIEYELTTGLSLPAGGDDGEEIRYEPGDKLTAGDIPKKSLPWLLEQGILVEAEEAV